MMTRLARWIIFIGIISIAIGVLWLYGFFSPYNYLTAQVAKHQGNLTLLLYQKTFQDTQEEITANKIGFHTYRIPDSTLSNHLLNGAESYNHVVMIALNEKFGKDWKSKFDKSVDSLFRLDCNVDVIQFMLHEDGIKKQMKELDSLYKTKTILNAWSPMSDSVINVDIIGNLQRYHNFITLKKYHVNPYKRTVQEYIN